MISEAMKTPFGISLKQGFYKQILFLITITKILRTNLSWFITKTYINRKAETIYSSAKDEIN